MPALPFDQEIRKKSFLLHEMAQLHTKFNNMPLAGVAGELVGMLIVACKGRISIEETEGLIRASWDELIPKTTAPSAFIRRCVLDATRNEFFQNLDTAARQLSNLLVLCCRGRKPLEDVLKFRHLWNQCV